MKRLIAALLLVGCTRPIQQPPPIQPTRDPYAVYEAYLRYNAGQDSEDTPEGKEAFRSECVAHATDRELTLDQLRVMVQVHAFAWREWYGLHCAPVPDVIDRESGKKVDAVICNGEDAGAPPARIYVQSREETLARAQRDACERAQ